MMSLFDRLLILESRDALSNRKIKIRLVGPGEKPLHLASLDLSWDSTQGDIDALMRPDNQDVRDAARLIMAIPKLATAMSNAMDALGDNEDDRAAQLALEECRLVVQYINQGTAFEKGENNE